VAWAEANFRTKWDVDPFSRLATTDIGQKLGRGLRRFSLGEGGSPSNSVAMAEACETIPSGILIHLAVWNLCSVKNLIKLRTLCKL